VTIQYCGPWGFAAHAAKLTSELQGRYGDRPGFAVALHADEAETRHFEVSVAAPSVSGGAGVSAAADAADAAAAAGASHHELVYSKLADYAGGGGWDTHFVWDQPEVLAELCDRIERQLGLRQ
jgi:hypothetical protein